MNIFKKIYSLLTAHSRAKTIIEASNQHVELLNAYYDQLFEAKRLLVEKEPLVEEEQRKAYTDLIFSINATLAELTISINTMTSNSMALQRLL